MRVEIEPGLVEEAVLQAVAARSEGRLFFREREALYGVRDPEERARCFTDLASAWFVRLGIAQPLEESLAERPELSAVARCLVARPPRPSDAGAELLVRPAGAGETAADARVLHVLLGVRALLDAEALRPFLRRELQHVVDMLDPGFGYAPALATPGGPGRQRLIRDRYRVLWDTTIDGRLSRRGWLGATARAERRCEFLRTFGWLGADAETMFDRFFDDDAPTHAALVAFAAAPGGEQAGGASVCPLCGFMTPALEREAALSGALLAEILGDAPTWRPSDGCCAQCAELYRARRLSCASAAALPGIR